MLFFATSLPAVLSDEQALKLLRRYRNGDVEARESLIAHNIRFVLFTILKSFNNITLDKEDLVSAGLIGLIKAVDTFDSERGFSFSSYAFTCISNEIKIFLRKELPYISHVTPFDSVLDYSSKEVCLDDATFEANIEDYSVNLEDDYVLKEEHVRVRQLIDDLDEQHQKIIMLYFKEHYTHQKIADELGVHRTVITKYLIRFKEEIKDILEGESLLQDFISSQSTFTRETGSREKILIR